MNLSDLRRICFQKGKRVSIRMSPIKSRKKQNWSAVPIDTYIEIDESGVRRRWP